jgi:hypothetical protein
MGSLKKMENMARLHNNKEIGGAISASGVKDRLQKKCDYC